MIYRHIFAFDNVLNKRKGTADDQLLLWQAALGGLVRGLIVAVVTKKNCFGNQPVDVEDMKIEVEQEMRSKIKIEEGQK